MLERLLADAVVVLHLAFVAFALAGGLLVLRWRWVALLHLPALAWAAFVEFTGRICPLTPLENALRAAAGTAAYQGGFVEHYLLPVLYPAELTREVQLLLGAGLLAFNVAVYAAVAWQPRRRRLD
ncbi:DUF2784 domain-containing protein [Ramlibacter sp. AN1133]|uniref:DUF2784 domain-containing protein n=1 Tax=Ramlibacter sp. AN1133 TaxID=3133429 RepID=UPI0030C53686